MSLSILPLKCKSNDVVVNKLLPPHPTMVALVAQRKSGKTTMLVNMLIRKDMYAGFFHTIHIWSPTLNQDVKWKFVVDKLPKEFLHTSFNPEEFEAILGGLNTKERNLFIFDDSASERGLFSGSYQGSVVKTAFAGRHLNLSMWLVAQSFRALSVPFRNNIHHWILFRPANLKEAKKVAEELGAGMNEDDFLRMWMKETERPYSFLYVNFEAEYGSTFRNGFSQPIRVDQYIKSAKMGRIQKNDANGGLGTKAKAADTVFSSSEEDEGEY
jgi:hypothetical protein